MLRTFMRQVSIELAKDKEDPEEWARGFIKRLHEGVDVNESSAGEGAARLPSHEMAREEIDRLGKELLEKLRTLPS